MMILMALFLAVAAIAIVNTIRRGEQRSRVASHQHGHGHVRDGHVAWMFDGGGSDSSCGDSSGGDGGCGGGDGGGGGGD